MPSKHERTLHLTRNRTLAAHPTRHGQTISVVMPYVLQFNRPAVGDSFEALGRYLDLEDASVTGVTDWVLGLRETCGIPHTLAEIGVTEEQVPSYPCTSHTLAPQPNLSRILPNCRANS